MELSLSNTMDKLTKRTEKQNVNQWERIASLVGGGMLLAYGLKKREVAGWSLAALGGTLIYRGATGHCDVYNALGINTARSEEEMTRGVPYELGIRVDKSIVINKSPEEVYRFWRNFENLPRFMDHLVSVDAQDDRKSHWVAKAPAGFTVEWDAEVINEIENKLIGWRSLEGADVDNAGSVHFDPAPNGRGCEVKVSLQYNPPAGALGAAVAKMFGEEPNQQIQDDLHRLKQLLETGEIPTTEGQPSGRSAKKSSKKVWDRDNVTHSSEESFPASDAPSFTPQSL